MGNTRGTEPTRVLENEGAGDGGGRPSGLSGSRRLRAATESPPQPESAGAEAAEEGASDLLNWIVDDLYDLVTGTSESEFKQLVAVYEENGLDHTKALLSALGDRGTELGLDILGAFSPACSCPGGKAGITPYNTPISA